MRLFSAARSEFKHLEHFYFRNFTYERMWKDNRRQESETTSTLALLRTYSRDYRVVFVGDASMSPYEITLEGGSVEHYNSECGAVWMKRIVAAFPRLVWLNPEPQEYWGYTPSVQLTRELIADRMFRSPWRGSMGRSARYDSLSRACASIRSRPADAALTEPHRAPDPDRRRRPQACAPDGGLPASARLRGL